MQITTVDALCQALRDSKLLTDEELLVPVRELEPHWGDLPAALKLLVERKYVTVYQLRKVIHAKAEELFLGPYVILDKLGEGGMGRVYKARHVRMGRQVALKIIRPNLLSNPIIRGRYQREVEAAGTLRHPNIVCVDDAGESHGKYYMAMEFVDGIDLSRLIKDRKPLDAGEACEYVRQAALGLQHAHENGFVHRDIKPSNIIVSGERHVAHAKSPAVVKILDMGLVRPLGFDDVPGAAELTRAGTVVGTPDYMAPEQAKNSSGVDPRADLYSLGCTLYYLLTAQAPFPDGSPIEKLLKHQLDPTPLVRARRPELPQVLDDIIGRLTAKRPEDRYPSAAAVAEVLAPIAALNRGPVAAPHRPRAVASAAVPVPLARAEPAAPPLATPAPGVPVMPPPPSSQAVPVLAALPADYPVAPSDPTPRPPGLPAGLQPLLEAPSPFAALADPPSVPLGLSMVGAEPAPDEAKAVEPVAGRGVPRTWWIAGAVVAVAVLAVGVVLTQLGGRPAPPGPPGPVAPPVPPPPKRPAVTPKLDQMVKLHPQALLVPDGSGLVVVAYPATYFKEKDTPFAKGTGPTRLAQWAHKLAEDTKLDPFKTDRLIYTASASAPDRYFMTSEGPYVTRDFAPELFSLPRNPLLKRDQVVRNFLAPGWRHTAVFTPPTGAPVYAVMSSDEYLEKMRPRFATERTPPSPELDTGMVPALNEAAEKPPLLFAVAGESYKLPFGEKRPLGDYGIELVTLRVQMQERVEIELAVTGADAEVLRQGVREITQGLRAEKLPWGNTLADLLAKPGNGVRQDSRYRWTIKTSWTADQFSTFLDHCLSE
ncbi:serine/threonine protein kinase [Gemmata sp.]|uniref:serine/threonine protein kinase n=1 Tax=Gemmata sp. TaxID=1914242 RepID=UPI003F6EB446